MAFAVPSQGAAPHYSEQRAPMPAPGTATNVLTKSRAETLVGVISTKVQRPSQLAEVAGKLLLSYPLPLFLHRGSQKGGEFLQCLQSLQGHTHQFHLYGQKTCVPLFSIGKVFISVLLTMLIIKSIF